MYDNFKKCIKSDNIVNKCNNTYHWTIKIKSFDVISSTYIDFVIEKYDKYSKF